MYILANMWFTKLIKQFFFWIDKIVFNFISEIYDLLITIARTSVLSQADIADMADRIYKLLAIFMIFKVTLSLITYVVNPDDFSDKTKGVSKLGTNIIISLAMLILVPYVFSYAYQIQTIILEDNSLATLIFGTGTYEDENGVEKKKTSFLNTAGDDMAFVTLGAFISPNYSVGELHECTILYDGNGKFDNTCYDALKDLTTDENFPEQTLINYKAAMEHENLGMLLRQDLVLATDEKNDQFIFDYKFIFSTVVGVVIILLLITFCMDVAVRSLKLAMLQLIAPIPIISYVDPKSGKDGLFKKWYEMCFKTYLSLFVRLLALYFAVYIISRVADMKLIDVVDGSQKSGFLLSVFIIIGALMFAKQLPKILEGLGIKLDGDGKFFLNPLKKFDEQTLGGKRLTGAAGGMAAGLIGGRGVAGRLGGMISGAGRGFAANKGYAGGLARQADVNRKLREARIQGAGFWGSRAAVLSNRYGLDDADLEGEATNLRKDKRAIELKRREVDTRVKAKEVEKKQIQDGMSKRKEEIQKQKQLQEAISKMEDRAKSEIQNGNGGSIGRTYLTKKAQAEYYENNIGKTINGTTITSEMAANARADANTYLNDVGMKAYMSAAARGNFDNGKDDKTFVNSYEDYVLYAEKMGMQVSNDGDTMHTQYGKSKRKVGDIERSFYDENKRLEEIDNEIRNVQATETVVIDGQEVSIEEAERLIKEREQRLKDKQDQRKLQRGYAKDSRIGGGS